MKKMIKKVVAAFMAMALVAVGMLAVNKAEVKAAAATMVTVVVQGEGAKDLASADNGNLYLHAWGGYVTGDWGDAPKMTNNGDGTWKIENLVCTGAMNVIIKNASRQTGNIEGIAVDKAEIFIEIPVSGDPIVTYGNAAAEVVEEAYYVTGNKELCGGEGWQFRESNNKMTNNSGVWSITYEDVPVGNHSFKITNHIGTWSNSWGNNGQNYNFGVASVCDVTITFNESTKAITVNGDGLGTPPLDVEKIIIAGTTNLCGGSDGYNQADDNNKMTANGDVYTKTYTGLVADTYAFKFAANGAWSDNWGGTFSAFGTETEAKHNGSDISFETTYTQSSVTIELDLTNFDYGTRTGATFTITVVDTTPAEDPSNEDPSNEDPSNEDPSNEDPSNEDPSNEDPSNEDPSNEDPSNEDPSNEDPSNEDPSNEDPSNEDPSNEDSSDDTPAAGSTWIIAGDSKDLFGTEWDAAKATNAMTDTDGDGVYTKTYSNVPVGLYSFKVTNGTWKEAYGDNGNNYQFKVDKACDVTITFDTKTKKVNATGTGLGEITFEVDKIIIAGTANICGEAYKENLDDNKMSATGKVYTKTYTGLAAGKYQIKFCANGAWTDNWGGKFEKSGVEAEAEYGAKDNISFETTYTQSTVTVELDLTNFDFSTKKGATFTITITDTTPESDKGDDTKEPSKEDDSEDPSKEDDSEDTNTYHVAGDEGLCGTKWDPSKNQMVKNEDGTWSIKFTNVNAGKYEFKIATNGDWNNGEYNLEGDASNKGPNAVIEVKEDGSTVIITFDGTKAIITMNDVPAGGGEDTPAGDSSMVAIFAILAVLAAGVVTVAVAKRRAIEE